ncbi:MAG: helix-turn-helix domain-containing protein [Ruminococcus sp.]|jgi:transcriptional regulator with XRE-family HTH domain
MEENRFRKLRMEKNPNAMEDFKIKDLAKEIGIAAPKISELENDRRRPSLSELQAYHNYFNVPYEYLLGENNSRYYENMTLSDEIGLTGDSIHHLKRIYKSFKSYPNDSEDRKTPEGRTLRTINYLLEEHNSILLNIGLYLDSALCDADIVQLQYVPLKFLHNSMHLNINGFNCEIDEMDYKSFCENYIQKITAALRVQWEFIHAHYQKQHTSKIAPDTN